MHDLLNEQEETLEDIKMDGIHLIQKKKGFRYGMDDHLVAVRTRNG